MWVWFVLSAFFVVYSYFLYPLALKLLQGMFGSQEVQRDANIRPVTSHFVYKPPDPDFTFVKPECCEYVFRKPAHVAAKPVHQTLFRCSSDRPSLAGSAFAKPKIDPSVVQKITSQSSWLMWDVRFGEFLLLCL